MVGSTFFFTVVGSVGGFIMIYYGIKRLVKFIKSVYAGRQAKNNRYYYNFVELSCKWLQQGQKYSAFWTWELVSKINGLNEMLIGLGYKSVCKFTIKTKNVRPATNPNQNLEWENYIYEIDPNLHKKEKKIIPVEFDGEAYEGKPLPEYILFVSECRCDKLLLRVVFDKIPANDVRFFIRNQIGETIFKEVLNVDIVNNECKKEIYYTRPGLAYIIIWENEEK